MAIEEPTGGTEPRALSAALSGPAFTPRVGNAAMHVANRHVERWAPEATANQQRSMRALGFVDRLIAPWMETAQHSASLRLLTQYRQAGLAEHEGRQVSWVFPRPWYRDELDWMAAAREQAMESATPRMILTTRGTYVPPQQQEQSAMAMPTALYEYVAPGLSVGAVAAPEEPTGHGSEIVGAPTQRREAYSPLVPLAAVQAAEVMSRTMQRLPATTSVEQNPALRNVLANMLARAAAAPIETRAAMSAPEMVTPPAPRESAAVAKPADESALHVTERFAAHRAQMVEVQRIARQTAEREYAARIEVARTPEEPAASSARVEEPQARTPIEERARVEERVAQRIAERVAREQGERTIVERTAEAARQADADERAREERVAQRAGAQRLHEQARVEAAAHARAAAVAPVVEEQVASPVESPRIPLELSAALAALPPELARHLVRHPDRAVQAIDELTEAFRTVELIARSQVSGTAFEPTRGPRLMMPAGLGGLVAAVDRAHAIERSETARFVLPSGADRPTIATRVPTLSFLAGPAPMTGAVAPSALAATQQTAPAALGHVAWADRWLARFSGASQRSLDVLAGQHTDSPRGLQALAAAAPGSVFVSPAYLDSERDFESVSFDGAGRALVTPSANQRAGYAPLTGFVPATLAATFAPTLASVPFVAPEAPTPVVRFDDNAETPDDVFARISEASSRARGPERVVTPVPAPVAAAPFERQTIADTVSHELPTAAGAGFAAQLASSPFAPALSHVLPLPAAARFDVRALLGGALSASYLAGLLADTSNEVEVASARALPSWSRWLGAEGETVGTAAERFVPSWDATYVRPEGVDQPERADEDFVAPRFGVDHLAPLMTYKSALLSWDAETVIDASRPDARVEVPAAATAAARAMLPSVSRNLVEAMSMPMLGDVAGDPSESTWAAPGMIANRAHTWSVAQERSSSDLAFDFVTPELVLAARVYGLGPAEAAQAMRLAIAGPGQLSAMAGTVDRTFLQALTIESDRRERARIQTAYPVRSELTSLVAPRAAIEAQSAAAAPTGAAFGVERRAPRGAYLWPSGTVAALNLHAPAPDGAHAMPVAALELLAAQAVAELGTFAALGLDGPIEDTGDDSQPTHSLRRSVGAPSALAMPMLAAEQRSTESAEPAEYDVLGAAAQLIPPTRRARFESLYLALGQSPAGRTWSPAARAARALALAGRGEDAPATARERAAAAWDVLPVVYASEGTPLDDDVVDVTMPVVGGARGAAARGRRGDGDSVYVDGRPGLGMLSSRAGEALGSYVTPAPAPAAPKPERERSVGAVLRAPTAAQEMVQTGRSSGRYGGGEVEIPGWFESAARKMFDTQTGSSPAADGISISELTLISSAPSHQIAASTKTAPAAAPLSPALGGAADAKPGQKVDIEKLANEIYRQILAMMDAARARNGEPYL